MCIRDRYSIYAAPTYLNTSNIIGNFTNKVPKPRHTRHNCKPWPEGMPNKLGIVLKKPNFIPEVVKIVLLGPGVTYITKLYTLTAKINSQVITIFNL